MAASAGRKLQALTLGIQQAFAATASRQPASPLLGPARLGSNHSMHQAAGNARKITPLQRGGTGDFAAKLMKTNPSLTSKITSEAVWKNARNASKAVRTKLTRFTWPRMANQWTRAHLEPANASGALSLVTAQFLSTKDWQSSAVLCHNCADLCDLCAAECDRVGGMNFLADSCRTCARACREIVV